MKQKIKTIFAFTLVFSFLLTGCNNKKPSSETETESSHTSIQPSEEESKESSIETYSSEEESIPTEESSVEESELLSESEPEEESEVVSEHESETVLESSEEPVTPSEEESVLPSEEESLPVESEEESVLPSEDSPINQYTITVINGTGSGTYNEGSSVTITADVPEDQLFDYWDLDGVKDSEDNPYTFTVSSSATYTAHFKEKPHPLAACTKNVYKKSDKDFKVLSLADIQLHDGASVDVTLEVIDQLVKKEQPDMIVHVGDLINDDRVYPSLNNYVTVLDKIDSYDIPWAAVLGNHDYETYSAGYDSMKTTTSEELMEKFMSYDNCVVSYGPEYVTGKSNYIVNVLDETTNELVHSLYFMDSVLSGVQDDHATFYRDAVEYSTLLNNDQPVESSIYVHIPLPQYTEVLKNARANEYRDLVGCYNRGSNIDLAAGSEKVFEAIEELGVTKNVICGHDHDNAYYGYYHGVRLAYSMKSSDGDDYRNPAEIGGAILRINEGEETDFYYSKADIQFENDEGGNLSAGLDILPYWRYSGAKLHFDIEMLGSSGTIQFSLLGTNAIRYNIDEKDRYGAWNRLTALESINVANKEATYGDLTKIEGSDKYHYVLDVTDIPLNTNTGEVACGDETMKLIYFVGGSATNKYRISHIDYEFEDITETDQIDLSEATIDEIPDQYYSFSQAIKPNVVVKYNDNDLAKVNDILITYSNNTEVGVATVKVTPSGKGAHRYKGEKIATFNIVVNPDGDTVPGHENAIVVDSNLFSVMEKDGLTPVNDWKNCGKAFYFEIKRMSNGSLTSGESFRFSLCGTNANPGAPSGATSDWNRLSAYYYFEFKDDSAIVHLNGSTENIATITDLGDSWLGVTIPYSAFELNESGEGAMGNENETFTHWFLYPVTRSVRIDNINSQKVI